MAGLKTHFELSIKIYFSTQLEILNSQKRQ